MYREINRRFFGGELPSNLKFRWIANQSEGEFLDSRCEYAAVQAVEEGWEIELNDILKEVPEYLYQTIAHEMIHLKIGFEKVHGSKEWNREFRRIQGLGFFKRSF